MGLNWHQKHERDSTIGELIADKVATAMGSWKFIIGQTAFILFWMTANSVHGWGFMWDGYPFILLNLVFSTQAAYAAPIIMMAQNRAADRDKVQAEHQYETQEAQLAKILALLEPSVSK